MLTHLGTSRSLDTDMPAAAGRDEDELIARARHGDVDAFETLYHANAPRVFALCVRLTADRGRAAELTQDVFVRAWERLSAFRGESAFASWLHRIAVNALLMHERAERRRSARVHTAHELPGAGDVEVDRPSASHTAAATPPVDVEQTIDLERAIGALPPGARRVFVLHDVAGYRHEEIARMTGLAQGTLRAQLHRARRLLMEALQR